MVAQTVRQGSETFRGVRPLNPTRDLRQVALLLEEAFREDLGALHAWSRVPVLRQVGAALMSTAFMPVPTENLRGFVYEENGRIIGNVTLTLDDNRAARWLISNVAVTEKYRRRGIARQLMDAAIDEARGRGARWIILNVRPWNVGAVRLYQGLGFETVDTETQYIRTRVRPYPATPLPLVRLRDSDLRAAYEVARAGMSEELRAFRPPSLSDFGVRFEDRMAERALDFFILQSTERWGYFQNNELTAVVSLHGQRLGTPHSLDIRVIPSARGALEAGLVAAALKRLAHFPPREIQARVLASHSELIAALADAGFIPTRGLTLMAKKLRN
ncbi:MAG TPA: GNAT family N-acetyltransferase [Anaerolineae bacterium]|nr:GNAT family N-acetyltransferase [Anaerolineae bacterium]